MFHLAQNFFNWIQVRREYRLTITVLGINNAGKTSILNIIRGVPDASVAPTMGFNKHDIDQGSLKVTFFDLGGSPKIRNTWTQYFARAHGIIFVVDASDPKSFDECKKVFEEAFGHTLLASKPLLILANKNDVTGCADGPGVRTVLGLSGSSSSIRVQGCSTASKLLIDEGFAWLFQAIVSQWSTLSPRVDADVAAEEQKMREAFAERKRQVELKKAQRLKDEEAKLAAEALQATISEGCALNVPEVCALNARISSYPCRHCHCLILLSYRFP
jgi:small GTP-binding protein